jgi:hypothetical protein
MKKYRVTVELECIYELDASDEETAKDMAYEWFTEAIPTFNVEEIVKAE